MVSEKQTDVLQALASIGPMTNYELRLQLGISKDSCVDVLRRLKRKDMVRVVAYEYDGSGAGRKVQVYAEGGGGDADKPAPTVNTNPVTRARMMARRQKEYGVWAGLVR